MKTKELRELTSEELQKELDTLVKGLFNLRFRKVTDVVENPAALKQHRKDIARIKTILRERELQKSPSLASPVITEK
jgi:large subunit ribosomal protein L29